MHTRTSRFAVALPHLASALLLLASGLSLAACESLDEPLDEASYGDRSFEMGSQFDDLRARLEVLEDRESIRSAAACYGRGHDEIFRHLGGDQSASLAILSACFTDDVQSEVYFFGDPAPAAQLTSLAQLIGFIEGFAIQTGYTSAQNVVGDVHIEFTGPDTAVMYSETATPHFITGVNDPAGQPSVDFVTARYIDEMVRGADGVWRTAKKTLILDEFWRGTGFYPLALQ